MLEELQQDTFSQFGEDKWLVDNVELPAKGFYVDVGAGNPINLSNSYLFEKLGWNGLLIDADPRHRPAPPRQVALVSPCFRACSYR